MNQNLEHLIVLQAQDFEIDRLRGDLLKLPEAVRLAERRLLEAEAALTKTRAAVAAEEKLRRDQESEITTLRAKTARLGRSLEAATSAAQVAAFDHEIAFAQRAILGLEDQELASMERSEALEAEVNRLAAQAEAAKKALRTAKEQEQRQTAEWSDLLRGLEQQRRDLRPEIESDVLASYDRLRKGKGTAIAEALGNATDGKCAACQMSVRPQRWQDLTSREHQDQIFTCESCGRMLFWDPRRDTPRAWEAGDRLRRAQAGSAR